VRQALDDDEAGGVAVRKGSLILIAPWILHRHRHLWAAPERFDPSRFMPDAVPPPRFAYMPFGAGSRICVGAPFALTELVLVIASLVRAFRIEVAMHRPVAPVGLGTLQPDTPAPFRLISRGSG
jgi:unspecific monooxygenase